jgi:hypothetical protein
VDSIEQRGMDWCLLRQQRCKQRYRATRRCDQSGRGASGHSHNCGPDLHRCSGERLRLFTRSNFAERSGRWWFRVFRSEYESSVCVDIGRQRAMDQRDFWRNR